MPQEQELSSNWQKIDQLCLEAGTPIRGSLIDEICQLFKQPALLTDEELKAAWDGAFDNPVTFTKKPTVEDLFNVRLRAIAKAQLDKK